MPNTTPRAQPLKDFSTAMNIERVGPLHFKFSEENKPPDSLADSMILVEEGKEQADINSEVPMQEDSDMGVEDPHNHASRS